MEEGIVDYATSESDYLPHVIARCVEKAGRLQTPHRFRLNGAVVVVSPGRTPEEVDEEVQKQWRAGRATVPSDPAA